MHRVVAVFRVRRIDAHDTMTVIPEIARELSPSGATLQRWAYPLNETPIGIADDELVTSIGDSAVLAIQSNGSFRVLPLFATPPAKKFPCPTTEQDTPYDLCFVFEDMATHAARRVLYLAPCS